MANEKRFRKGSRTSERGCTHGSVSAKIMEDACSMNRLGSTMLSDVGDNWTAALGTVVKADTDAVSDATRIRRRDMVHIIGERISTGNDKDLRSQQEDLCHYASSRIGGIVMESMADNEISIGLYASLYMVIYIYTCI